MSTKTKKHVKKVPVNVQSLKKLNKKYVDGSISISKLLIQKTSGTKPGKNIQPLRTKIHTNSTDDIRIEQINPLIPPAIILENFPLSQDVGAVVQQARMKITNIIQQKDSRLICVVGPCSIHDPKAALEYAIKLSKLARELQDDLCIVMRVYFEKPRTTIGWKGLINDPFLDNTFNINKGLAVARNLLIDINRLGLPCGVEFLDTIIPQFIGDLVSWGAIGARTTESQIHRELSSGLSCPVGFKNGTMGNIEVAAAAIKAASYPHHFLGVTKQGLAAIVETKGNPLCHTILRGGKDAPNFDPSSVAKAYTILKRAKINSSLIIDCSHGNSQKIHSNQPVVADSVASQIRFGNKNIVGVMIESNLNPGKQSLPKALFSINQLQYGVSVTDSCISFEDTVPVLRQLAEAVRLRRSGKVDRQYISAKL